MNDSSSFPTSLVEVVCALIWKSDRVLLAQRAPEKRLGGLWEFPGGKVELGESPEEALHRELAEELGCRVEILGALPTTRHIYPWCEVNLHPFVCQLQVGSPEPQALEHIAIHWSLWKDVPDYELAGADYPVIQNFNQLWAFKSGQDELSGRASFRPSDFSKADSGG